MAETRDYDYRRGHIELVNASTGDMRCRKCGAQWRSNLRGGGLYYRGSWTCSFCGANSKGGFSAKTKA